MPIRQTTPAGAPCWIDVFTSDADRAVQFYGGLFGWTAERGGPEYGGYITFSKDGHIVAGCMGHDGSDPNAEDFWTVYLASDDPESTVAAAAAAGAVVYLAPTDVPAKGVMAMLGDPTGATVGVWQAAGHAGFELYDEPGAPAWFELHTNDFAKALGFYRPPSGGRRRSPATRRNFATPHSATRPTAPPA